MGSSHYVAGSDQLAAFGGSWCARMLRMLAGLIETLGPFGTSLPRLASLASGLTGLTHQRGSEPRKSCDFALLQRSRLRRSLRAGEAGSVLLDFKIERVSGPSGRPKVFLLSLRRRKTNRSIRSLLLATRLGSIGGRSELRFASQTGLLRSFFALRAIWPGLAYGEAFPEA